MRFRRAAGVLSLFVAAAGCGGGSAALRAEVRRLRVELTETRRAQRELDARVSTLADHAYALEDRLKRPAAPARMPIVRLVPSEAPIEDPFGGDDPIAAPSDVPSDSSGRPVLRLSSEPRTAAPVTERLPVAPLPLPSDRGVPAVRPVVLNEDPLAAVRTYESAYALVRTRRLEDALVAFEEFLRRYPHHPYADNALYWRGESYYARGEYLRAVGEFERLLTRYPDGNKAPDALLKLGLCYRALGDAPQADRHHARLRTEYPQSEAARRLASHRGAPRR